MERFAARLTRGVALLWALLVPILFSQVGFGQVNVLTNRYNPANTSANLNETVLTTANVNTTTFGKAGSYFVDGVIFAQPLYAEGITVNGTVHNVLFVATMHDVLYAFDADQVGSLPLWTADFRNLAQGIAPAPVHIGTSDGSDGGIADTLGIMATPAIDLPNNRIFVVTDTLENGTEFFRIRSIDIRSGALLASTAIGGSVPASGSIAGATFIPGKYGQRAALAIADGQVWVTFTSRPPGDKTAPWQGWVMTYDPGTLAQTGVFATSRTNGNSIWQSGFGPAVDASGNVYYLTGNGGIYDGVSEFPETLLKMNFGSTLTLNDWYTPDNPNGDDDFDTLNHYDLDLSVNGPMLIPGTDLVVFGGKTGDVYSLHTSNLGKLTPNDTQLAQFFHVGAPTPYTEPSFWSDRLVGMAFWPGSTGGTLYAWPGLDSLHAYTLNADTSTFTQSFAGTYNLPGQPSTALAISANGTTSGTGILWAPTTTKTVQANGVGQSGELHAYDAANPGQELWNSEMAASDRMGSLAKWVPVTVANGRVYVANSAFVGNYGDGSVVVYGLKSSISSHVLPSVSLASPVDGYTAVSGNPINITTSASANSSALTTVSFVDGTQVLETVAADANTHQYSYTWSSAPIGIHTITARAVDTTGAVTVSPAITINVIGTPTYSVSASPASIVLPPGGTVVSTITVTPLSGFSGPPSLGAIGTYPGVTLTLAKTSNTNVFTATLTALSSASPGAYPLILNTGAGGQPNALSLPVTIAKTGVASGSNTFTVSAPGGTLGTPVVFSEGVPSSSLASPDFTLIQAGTTCTGAVSGTCTVSILFTPQFAGLRRGAFNLVDTSNHVLATYYFSGTGAGAAPVFAGSATAAAVSTIYHASPGFPFGVTVDAAGNAFVVDVQNNQVLKVAPNQAVTTVSLGTTLNSPYGLTLDAAGNLYIADAGNNRILKLPYGSSTATALNITGLTYPEGVAVDGAGNIFVANTRAAVTGSTGNIIKLTASGTQSTLSATGLHFPSTLAIDAVGDIFIADTYNNRVLELPASGPPVTIGTGLSLAAAVAVDAAGDVFIADKNNGRVVEVPATLSGPGTGTQITLATGLLMPTALALDGKGDVFVANIGTTSSSGNVVALQTSNANQTISFSPIPPQNLGTSPALTATASSGLAVSFSSYTPSVCTVSGSTATLLQSGTCTILASQPGGGAYLPAPGVVRSFTVLSAGGTLTTTFSVPAGVTLGTPQVFTEGVSSSALTSPDFTLSSTTCTGAVSGSCTVNVKFTSQFAGLRRGAVKLVDTQNNLIATGYISGIGANSQPAFTPGPVQNVWSPGAVPGVTVDGAGTLYFVTGAEQIYNTRGGHINSMPLGTTLHSPFGLALDGAGNLYIADAANDRVLELPYGSTTAVALDVAGLDYPQAVAVDGAGNIFIANTRGTASAGHGTVIKLAGGSHAQSTVIATGLNYPVGVTFDSSGDLFVADWGASRVLELSVSGESISIGSGLAYASAVGVDALGDVFIGDQNNNQLVEVPGTTSGPGTGTQVTIATGLLQPRGIVLDGSGNVYVADLGTATSYGNLAKIPSQ